MISVIRLNGLLHSDDNTLIFLDVCVSAFSRMWRKTFIHLALSVI
ncbi:hypothetical protein DsansV1_C09g0089071 [Dioscorea sansibarensis]